MADIEDPDHQPIALRRLDMHSVWRGLLWGSAAAMALAVVAGTAFSDLGAERLQQVTAALVHSTDPAKDSVKSTPSQPQIDPRQLAALEKQTRELTQTARDLTAERDRIKGRLAALEHSLNDITGAMKRQASQITNQVSEQVARQIATQTAADKAAHEPTPPATQPQQMVAAPPPAVTAPETAAAVPSPSTTAPATEVPITTASTPPAIEASPPIEGPIPMPRTRIAALEHIEESGAAMRHVVGIDLGGAASLDALRAYWSGVKANVGPDLLGLTPAYTIRHRASGAADYRLVLGPLQSSAAAALLCAKLAASRVYCRAGTFNVQKIRERQATTTERQAATSEREPPRPPAPLPGPMRDGIMSR